MMPLFPPSVMMVAAIASIIVVVAALPVADAPIIKIRVIVVGGPGGIAVATVVATIATVISTSVTNVDANPAMPAPMVAAAMPVPRQGGRHSQCREGGTSEDEKDLSLHLFSP
jgi:hypothetical protein